MRIFNYDPITGVFTWKEDRPNRRNTKAGSVAGFLHEGYWKLKFQRRSYSAHRVAWVFIYGELSECIDHINRNKTDNRLCNLRPASKLQNSWNTPAKKCNPHGRKGVSKMQHSQNWGARITINKRDVFLGTFESIDDAAHAYNKAAILNFGEFAVLNPIGEDKA